LEEVTDRSIFRVLPKKENKKKVIVNSDQELYKKEQADNARWIGL